jgi:hypothetical protein
VDLEKTFQISHQIVWLSLLVHSLLPNECL